MAFLSPFLRLLSDEIFLFFQCVAPALLVRNVYGCDPPFLRGNGGVKSGYVVKGGTVRGYRNTAKRIAVQNRNRSGTKVGQNRYRSETFSGWGGNKSLGGQPRLMRDRPLKPAETIPRRVLP
jgi:hypothetical protein